MSCLGCDANHWHDYAMRLRDAIADYGRGIITKAELLRIAEERP